MSLCIFYITSENKGQSQPSAVLHPIIKKEELLKSQYLEKKKHLLIGFLPLSEKAEAIRVDSQTCMVFSTHLASAFCTSPAASTLWSARSSLNLPDSTLPQGPAHPVCLEHPEVHIPLVYFPPLCNCDLLSEASLLHSPLKTAALSPATPVICLLYFFLPIAPITIAYTVSIAIRYVFVVAYSLYRVRCGRTSPGLFCSCSSANAKNTA